MATFLIVLGGLFQIIGVVAVVVSLRDTLQRLGRFEHRTKVVFGAAHFNLGGKMTASGVSSGPPPSVEQRMTNLEARYEGLRDEITTAIDVELKREIKQTHQILTASYEHDFAELSDFTSESLRSQKRPTIYGASFLIVGVILSTVGSVIA